MQFMSTQPVTLPQEPLMQCLSTQPVTLPQDPHMQIPVHSTSDITSGNHSCNTCPLKQ